MRGTANASTGGNYCGRAARGVSNLGHEQMRQIEAHRAKDRPTPWPHLAARYGVNEIDLRRMFEPANDDAAQRVESSPAAPSLADMLPGLWNAGLSLTEISNILKIDERSIQRMRERLGLAPRVRGDGLAKRRALGGA